MHPFYITPLIGAGIGYFTNWLAIKMIFRPYEEKRIFGIKVPFTPGLMASERERIANQIGFVITNHLLTSEDFKNKFNEIDFSIYVRNVIDLIEKEVCACDKTFNDVLKAYLKEDYDKNLTLFKDNINEKLKDFNKPNKSIEELKLIENDIIKVLPEFLEIVKIVLENNMYSIDTIMIDLFNDMIGSLLADFGPLIASFIKSESIYIALKEKIINSIETDYPAIENKVIDILYSNNNVDNPDFKLDNIIKVAIEKLLNQEVKHLSKIFDILKKEENLTVISTWIKKHFAKGMGEFISTLDINTLIIEKINLMPLNEVEDLIMLVAKKELTSITYVGGVLGFVIGLISLIFV